MSTCSTVFAWRELHNPVRYDPMGHGPFVLQMGIALLGRLQLICRPIGSPGLRSSRTLGGGVGGRFFRDQAEKPDMPVCGSYCRFTAPQISRGQSIGPLALPLSPPFATVPKIGTLPYRGDVPPRKASEPMTPVLPLLFVFFLCGLAGAQDLPPAILADQYLLEATEAMERGELQKAERAFKKIEALEVEPPPTFAYFYGKLLAEHGVGPEVWRKGQALLKQFVLSAGRESDYYTPTLKLLSMVEAKLEAARGAQADDAAYAAAAAQDTPEGYTAYMQRYPAGRHTAAAQAAQQRLRAEAARQRILDQVNAQMVRIEGGPFTMGCQGGFFSECYDDEKPAHQVVVPSFELSKYEVTQEQWQAVMGENPSEMQHCPPCPVEGVSWEDALIFLRKLNAGSGRYRLPSEAEWEYAARGGTQSRGYQYAGSDTLDAVGWSAHNSEDTTHPVGQKQANELGLHDLSGNVWEWIQDCWNESYIGAPRDGRAWESGDCSRRVLRGGSWAEAPRNLRSANRSSSTASNRFVVIGFRLARSVE